MYVGPLPPVSNRASWSFSREVVDDDTGELVDISALSFTLEVRDTRQGCIVLSASTDNGKITNPSTGLFTALFTRDEMAALCADTYDVGVTISDGDDVTQFIIGTLPVLDGVVSR
jgi:hypothetical protein